MAQLKVTIAAATAYAAYRYASRDRDVHRPAFADGEASGGYDRCAQCRPRSDGQ
jgi:hypothetical protein